jgi:hypothetical protein
LAVLEQEQDLSYTWRFEDSRCFEAKNGLKGIKGSRWKKIKQEAKVVKTGHPVFQIRVSGFSITDRVWVVFKI